MLRNKLIAGAAGGLLLLGLGVASPANAAPVSSVVTASSISVERLPVVVRGVRCPHRIEVCHLYQWWDVFHWYPGRYCQCYGPYIP